MSSSREEYPSESQEECSSESEVTEYSDSADDSIPAPENMKSKADLTKVELEKTAKVGSSSFFSRKPWEKPSGLRTIPTLFTKKRYRILFGTGIFISILTSIFIALAFKYEMAGLFAARPYEVVFFIVIFCFLFSSGLLLYPLLVVHFRERILEQEGFNTLSKKFQEGNAELSKKLAEGGVPIEGTKVDESRWAAAWDEVAADHPDFAYLYTVVDQHFRFNEEISDKKQTLEQKRKDYLRGLIRATATEHIEDSTFSIPSYELPVTFCMLSVAFGFFIFSLIPFLGITEIVFGSSSINLVWAAGGFVGAYLYSLYPLFQRYTRRDLPPRAFLDYAIKVFLGTMAVTVFGNLFLLEYGAQMQFALAAVLGSVPFLLLNVARKQVFAKLNWTGKQETVGSEDVSTISGITYEYSLRLHEEGIMNIQQLAFANSELLSERTMFNRETVCDWKNEAILQLLTGNIPLDKTKKNPKREETLYCALTKVGINTVSDLSNFLQIDENRKVDRKESDENKTKLVRLLGLTDTNKDYEYMLTKICLRGEDLLGEIEKSVTTRALEKELSVKPPSRKES